MNALPNPTFNPAVPNDPEPGQTCEDCGKERWQHRDGGLVYGLICPRPHAADEDECWCNESAR